MLAWLGPKCPLATGEKMWTEFRMRWLAGKLGVDRLLCSEVVLPEGRFFPGPYAGTPADARRIFDRVCGYMKLDPNRFEFNILPDSAMPDAVGAYCEAERPQIVLAYRQLSDPERLVSTIAHELAHDILLGGGLITTREIDHEPLTDLVPVFLGLGLFAANAPLRDRSYSRDNRDYFQIDRQGYLPSRMLGYALALFAYVRGEFKPAWARYLRPDASEPLKRGLRYLRKTGDSLFRAATVHQPVNPPTEAEMIERLTTGSPTVRLLTVRDVAALDPPPAALIAAVARRLRDPDTDVQIEAARMCASFGEAAHTALPDLIWCLRSRSATDVQIEAARALASFGEAASSALPDLIACLRSRSGTLREYAAAALPVTGGPTVRVVPELTRLLQDPWEPVGDTAAEGLRQFAPSAASAIPALVQAMRKRAIFCRSFDALAAAVVAIDPPADVLKCLLDSLDPEIRRSVIESLKIAQLRR